MNTLDPNPTAGVLPVLETFHSLQFKELEIRDLTGPELRTQEFVQDYFEPQCITGAGVTREPIHLAVHRRGWLLTEAAALSVRVCDLSLRAITVQVPSGLHPMTERQIAVEIEGGEENQWFGFVGTLDPVDNPDESLTIRLDHPLDPQSLLGGVWRAPEHRGRVLIAVDDPLLSREVARTIEAMGFATRLVRHALPVEHWLGKALLTLDGERLQRLTFPEVIITDSVIGGRAGLELLSGLQLLQLPTLLVALRGFSDPHVAHTAASIMSLQVLVPEGGATEIGACVGQRFATISGNRSEC